MHAATIKVYDYYDTENFIDTALQLDPNDLYWNPPMRGFGNSSVSTTPAPEIATPKPKPACPECGDMTGIDQLNDQLYDQLNKSVC